MDQLRPHYYDDFVCIADACPMTCCMEWKIYVDEGTEERWKGMDCPAGGPAKGKLSDFVTTREGSRVIRLKEDHTCPHLQKGLCSMVLSYGEQTLSKTCHEFPREDHGKELSLLPSCPAVIDLIRERGFLLVGGIHPSAEGGPDTDGGKPAGGKAGDQRDLFLEILGRDDIQPGTALGMICYISLLQYEAVADSEGDPGNPGGDGPEILGGLPEGGAGALASPEELGELAGALRSIGQDLPDTILERSELFEDLSCEYRRQGMYPELLDPVAETGIDWEQVPEEELAAFKTAVRPFTNLLKGMFAAEIFGTVTPEEGDLYMMRLQWICMEYSFLMHCLLAVYLGSGGITCEQVRSYAVLTFRMMGYDQEDIVSYMEECFEAPVWEWGYFLLLLGPALV